MAALFPFFGCRLNRSTQHRRLLGDAVNVASRMESTGELGKLQVSQDIHDRLREEFVLEKRGLIDVKGKGQMPTWFLVSCNAFAAGG